MRRIETNHLPIEEPDRHTLKYRQDKFNKSFVLFWCVQALIKN